MTILYLIVYSYLRQGYNRLRDSCRDILAKTEGLETIIISMIDVFLNGQSTILCILELQHIQYFIFGNTFAIVISGVLITTSQQIPRQYSRLEELLDL